MNSDLRQALTPVMAAFQELRIPFAIGGSVASSAWGIARSTLDADLVADIKPHHVAPLYRLLQAAYYVDVDAMREAVQTITSFNLIHLKTMLKIDVFILKDREFDRQAFARTRVENVAAIAHSGVPLTAPEDIVINKLEWYHAGGEVSERQWNDVIGVLKVQRDMLDKGYLKRWASALGLMALLNRALKDAEID